MSEWISSAPPPPEGPSLSENIQQAVGLFWNELPGDLQLLAN